MPLDVTRYPITPEEQQALLAEAYQSGKPGRIDEILMTICRARGLIPMRPSQRATSAPPVQMLEPPRARPPLRTPGEVLHHLYMAPTGLSAKRLAAELGVPRSRITDILHGNRGITAQTALLLGQRFGNPAEFWLRLQMYHDLAVARRAAAAAPRPGGVQAAVLGRPAYPAVRPPAPPAG